MSVHDGAEYALFPFLLIDLRLITSAEGRLARFLRKAATAGGHVRQQMAGRSKG